MSESLVYWLEFAGRLHPVLLHLPIGFIAFLAVVEVAARWPIFREAAGAKRLLLLLSLISVTVAAGCGWILSWSGGYEETILAWHQWLGAALVPMVMLLLALSRRGAVVAYRVSLGLTVLLMVGTGHYGGALVRGTGYLFAKGGSRAGAIESKTASHPRDGETSEPTAYDALVQPIFNEYCVSCHGPEKAKGRLRLDGVAGVLGGADSGPVLEPGAAARSLLIQRMRLPEEDDDHMPPAGKKQPRPHDLAMLEWWINVGAPLDKTVQELKMPESQ